jgi:hypothetical protein
MKSTAQSTDFYNFDRIRFKSNIAKIIETDIYRKVGDILINVSNEPLRVSHAASLSGHPKSCSIRFLGSTHGRHRRHLIPSPSGHSNLAVPLT